jgi:hypothetical protein
VNTVFPAPPKPPAPPSADDLFLREHKAKQGAIERAKQETTPYQPGQKNIPKEIFERHRLPMCRECGLETVDFWDYQGSVDLEHFCTEECEELWQERRRDQQEKQDREREEASNAN